MSGKRSLCCVFSVGVNQLWSRKLIDLFPLKILEVEWDWWQSLGSVNMGPPMTCWYLNCPSGTVTRTLCVITTGAMEGVKTQLGCKGQASNTPEDLWFSLRGSRARNLSTLAGFTSDRIMENINQWLPEVLCSLAVNPNLLSSWTIKQQSKSLFFQAGF